MRKAAFCLLVVCLLFSVNVFAKDLIFEFKGNGVPAGFAGQVAAQGGTVVFSHPIMAYVTGLSDDAAAAIGASAGIAAVHDDVSFDLDPVEVAATDETYDVAASPTAPATAFFFPRQWHLRRIGAHTAWSAGRLGSASVRVAILDTGIDRQSSPHADLAGRVDYASGAAFAVDNPLCIPAGFTYGPLDGLNYHGTHVAATVASNAVAAAGVTSRVTVIPVKVLRLTNTPPAVAAPNTCTGGSGSTAGVLSGVLYAADIDADVANMSLGGGFFKTAAGSLTSLINKVFSYAHSKGMVIVVSAGNSAADLDHDGNAYITYCNTPNVVCVSATGPTASSGTNGPWVNEDAKAGYSNYGRSAINVAAPGGTGAGLVWAACSRSAVQAGLGVCRTGTFIVGSTGTSMASPHVTGLAALLVEDIGKDKPAQVKAALQQSADDLGQPGTDPVYGKGRINVPRAIGLQ